MQTAFEKHSWGMFCGDCCLQYEQGKEEASAKIKPSNPRNQNHVAIVLSPLEATPPMAHGWAPLQ